MSAPYRINSLVELCSGSLSQDKDEDGVGVAMRKATGWLEANPGRWFVVGELDRTPGIKTATSVGMDEFSAKRAGFEAKVVNNKLYARIPHPGGLPLSDFVTKRRPKRVDPLPRLESDPFEWSLSELRRAAETAREWLFPGVSHAAA